MRGIKCQSSLRLRELVSIRRSRTRRAVGRCLPESQSLLEIEMNILAGSELCTNIDIPGRDDGTLALLVLGGIRFRALVRH